MPKKQAAAPSLDNFDNTEATKKSNEACQELVDKCDSVIEKIKNKKMAKK